jgi:biopolymer transport protein ExbD
MLSRQRRLKPRLGIDMTPMIDIVFLLIIFFMVSSELVKNRGMAVNLPESASSDSETRNMIIISITQNGEIYLNQNRVDMKRLGAELKKIQVSQGQDTVVIRGDEQIPYREMIEVMDIAKLSGMKTISLATKQRSR